MSSKPSSTGRCKASNTHAEIGLSMSQHQRELPHKRAVEQTGALAFDYALNRRDHLRAEIVQRNQPVVVLSRRKVVRSGYKRTGNVLEFAAHHLGGMRDLLRDLQRALNSQDTNLDCETACRGEGKTSALGPPFEVIREKAGNQLKRRRGGGRHRSLTPEQIEEGIGILRNQARMTVDAARQTLRDAGIKTSDSALYRLVVAPAYGSRS
jgi:hypothetical protein